MLAALIVVLGDAGAGNDVSLTHCKEEHRLKTLNKSVTKFILGKVTFFKEPQFENAPFNVVQLFNVVGRVTVLKFVQLLNVPFKLVIFTAFEGSATSNKFIQPPKVEAKLVNALADVGIITLYRLVQFRNILPN